MHKCIRQKSLLKINDGCIFPSSSQRQARLFGGVQRAIVSRAPLHVNTLEFSGCPVLEFVIITQA